jgi:hypothetical protein
VFRGYSKSNLIHVDSLLKPFLSEPMNGAMVELCDPFGTVGSLRGMFQRNYLWFGDLLNQEGMD